MMKSFLKYIVLNKAYSLICPMRTRFDVFPIIVPIPPILAASAIPIRSPFASLYSPLLNTSDGSLKSCHRRFNFCWLLKRKEPESPCLEKYELWSELKTLIKPSFFRTDSDSEITGFNGILQELQSLFTF